MFEVRRGGTLHRGNHTIYTEAEAREAGMDYRNWKEITEAGQWALSDDGLVMEALSVKKYGESEHYPPRHRLFITFPVARQWVTLTAVFEAKKFVSGSAYRTCCRTDPSQTEAARSLVLQFVKAYATQFLYQAIDLDQLGRILRPNATNPKIWARRTLKNPEVQKMIREEIRKSFEDTGVNETFVIDIIKRAITLGAEGDKDGIPNVNAMLKGADQLAKLGDYYPEKGRGDIAFAQPAEWSSVSGDIEALLSDPNKGKLPKTEKPKVLLDE